MKKRFLVVPLAVGAAGASWAGTTLYGGAEAREAYDRLLVDMGEASGLTLVPHAYEAGFLVSEAVTEHVIGAGDDAVPLARFRHAIEHSPIGGEGIRAARIVTTLDTGELDPEARAGLERLFGDAAPFTIDSTIGLGGDAEHVVTVGAWRHEMPTGGSVASEPMAWTVHRAADGAVSGTGGWPGLTASFAPDDGPGGKIVLGASHDRFDYRPTGDGLWVGDYAAELGDLTARSIDTGMSASFSGTSLVSDAEIVDGIYRGGMELRVDAVDVPVIELDSLRFHAGFDGMPTSGLAGVIEAGDAFDAAAFVEDEAAIKAALAAYVDTLGALLRPGLGVDYGLELANAGGRALAASTVSWTGGRGGGGLADLDTVGDLVGAVRASATLDVDAGALERTPFAMFVNPASLAPWVVGDAEGLRSEIVVEDLVATVNGRAMPLEAFFGDALGAPLESLFDESI